MKLKHVISTTQFLDAAFLARIFKLADDLEKKDNAGKVLAPLQGKILASVFYEPSTRTRFSFESAMLKLGGSVITTENASLFSSAIKGESLEDSIRVIAGYADAIVLRHHEIGSAEIAAHISPVPVINAGDGVGEHPTQALLDIYTIKKEMGRLQNMRIALLGDLWHGRTVHSLLHLLTLYNNIKIYLISPPELKLPPFYKKILQKNKIYFEEFSDLQKIVGDVDVLYVTRIQKERFKSPRDYQKLKGSYVINPQILKLMKKGAVIMHPLPRVDEISPEVDRDPRSAYFRQAQNGLYIRMALLKLILGN